MPHGNPVDVSLHRLVKRRMMADGTVPAALRRHVAT
jgi:hypothetical protein